MGLYIGWGFRAGLLVASSAACWIFVVVFFLRFFVSEHGLNFLWETTRELFCVRCSDALRFCPDGIWARVDLVEGMLWLFCLCRQTCGVTFLVCCFKLLFDGVVLFVDNMS